MIMPVILYLHTLEKTKNIQFLSFTLSHKEVCKVLPYKDIIKSMLDVQISSPFKLCLRRMPVKEKYWIPLTYQESALMLPISNAIHNFHSY